MCCAITLPPPHIRNTPDWQHWLSGLVLSNCTDRKWCLGGGGLRNTYIAVSQLMLWSCCITDRAWVALYTVPQGMGLSRLSESDLWLLIRCTPRLVDYMYLRLLYVLMWQMACLDGKSVCWGGVWRVRGSQWNVAQYDCHLPEEMAEALIGSSIFELRCLSVCMQADASYKSVFDLEI